MTAINPAEIIRFIETTYPDVSTVYAEGDAFLSVGDDGRFPFATLIHDDRHDRWSNLSRGGLFRFNFGVGKDTFQRLFGAAKIRWPEDGTNESGYDFTIIDRLLPHPVYGMMYFACIVSPTAETFDGLRPLIDEAVAIGVARAERLPKVTKT